MRPQPDIKPDMHPVSDLMGFLCHSGCEEEQIDAMMFYLNDKLGKETDSAEKLNRHKKMLWSHRDVLLRDYKYQIRSLRNPKWIWEHRSAFGPTIKYRSVRH